MMTATHQLDELTDNQRRNDPAYLLDMDLSILGTSWSEYERYAQAIRQEYAHVPIKDYRLGRITILEKLLAHPQLYLTAYYHQRLEVQARENIEREIMLLRASE
jgi:predicted metal-dependent HD superfamily phosphohydrolase